MSLRQRIRGDKICCVPWKRYKHRIKSLPISAQCLFARKGIPYDVLEMELKEEGWLFPSENLFDVLFYPANLNRENLSCICITEDTPFDDTWTEEDYKNFYK